MLQPNANTNSDFMVFTGNANPVLAAEVAYELDVSLGLADVGRFSDGEVTVELKQNVRAREVFVVQSTCAPTNENLMELLIIADALKRSSAARITAVIPYFGYARQDRRAKARTAAAGLSESGAGKRIKWLLWLRFRCCLPLVAVADRDPRH